MAKIKSVSWKNVQPDQEYRHLPQTLSLLHIEWLGDQLPASPWEKKELDLPPNTPSFPSVSHRIRFCLAYFRALAVLGTLYSPGGHRNFAIWKKTKVWECLADKWSSFPKAFGTTRPLLWYQFSVLDIFHHCDKLPYINILMKLLFVLLHRFRGNSPCQLAAFLLPVRRQNMMTEDLVEQKHLPHSSQGAERKKG